MSPIKHEKSLFIVLLIIITLLISFGHFLNLSYEMPVSDQRQNLAFAYNTLKYHVYDDSSSDKPKPDYRREPMYPLVLMAGILLHPGIDLSAQDGKCITLGEGKCINTITYLKLANVILLMATAILSACFVFSYTKNILASGICYFLIAFSGSLGNFTSRFYSEPLATFLVVAVSFSLYSLAEKGFTRRRAIFCGLLLASLALTKAIFFCLVFLSCLLLFLWWTFQGIGISNSLKRVLFFLLGAFILIGPWIVRNYIQLGTFSIAGRSGLVLTIRANYNEMSSEEYFAFLLYSARSIRAVQQLIKDNVDPNVYEKISGPEYKDDAYSRIKQVQLNLGLTYPEANDLLFDEARSRILSNFGNHLAMVLPFAIRGSFPEEGYGFNPKNARYETIGIKKFGIDVGAFFISAKAIPNLILIAVFFGTFLLSLKFHKWALVWFLLPSIYGFGMYAFFTFFIYRFSIPLIPIFVICACIAGWSVSSVIYKKYA